MRKVISAVAVIAVLFTGVSLSFGKEKKKAAAPAAKQEQAADKGWKDIKTNAPDLVKASYKFDGIYIAIHFKNLSKDQTVRIKYQAKWKKNDNGKWVEEASQEGLTIRLRKLEDLTKEVRVRVKEVKDIVVEVDASVVS